MTVDNIERKSRQATVYIVAILKIQLTLYFPPLCRFLLLKCFNLLQIHVFCWGKAVVWWLCCGSGPCWASHFPRDPQTEALRLQTPRASCQASSRNPGLKQGSSSTRSYYLLAKLLPIRSELLPTKQLLPLLKCSRSITRQISLFLT